MNRRIYEWVKKKMYLLLTLYSWEGDEFHSFLTTHTQIYTTYMERQIVKVWKDIPRLLRSPTGHAMPRAHLTYCAALCLEHILCIQKRCWHAFLVAICAHIYMQKQLRGHHQLATSALASAQYTCGTNAWMRV